MRSQIAKHWTGKGYNSPLRQESKGGISGNLEYDAEEKTVNPSIEANYKNLSLTSGATRNLKNKEVTFGGELKYANKKGFNANVGVTGSNINKPTVNAGLGFKF
jgi:hypothetical protein